MDPQCRRAIRSLIWLIAIASIAFAQSSIFQKPIEPDWGDIVKPVVEDPVQIFIRADRKGTPVAVRSETPLPDVLVKAIQNARFVSEKTDMMYRITVKVPRSVDGDLAIDLMADPNVYERVQEARKRVTDWNPDDFLKQESKLKDDDDSESDIERRFAVLIYAAGDDPRVDADRLREIRQKQLTWLLDHVPADPLLAFPFSAMNADDGPLADAQAFEKLKGKWISAAEQKPGDGGALKILVNGLAISDPGLVATKLIAARGQAGAIQRLMGRLYADAAIGVTGRKLNSDQPATFSAEKRASVIGESARSAIPASDNVIFLMAALKRLEEDLHALAEQGDLPRDVREFCEAVLEQVRNVRPDETADCNPVILQSAARPDLISAKLISQPKPEYPKVADDGGVSGTLYFQCIIGVEGDIEELRLISGPLVFYETAREAVSRWKYRPTVIDGKPVSVRSQIQVNYER